MLSPRNVIELLSPARDYECARAAILHGADAVYIGAPQFSARQAASNSVEEIRKVVDLAHTYSCRVFVALNTVLFDHELKEAEKIAWQMYEAGVDALIIQDMGLLEGNMPPIELHASTQMDNRTLEKVQFLELCGFEQVVLARELTREQISAIAKKTHVRLECFIHGALCVSYSGQCYMSQSINGRSANRGECGQPCRLKYDLQDKDGVMLAKQKHLLSLKDQNQTENIEKLILAGASTLKIEGRLKDPEYVANVTLHYRRVIDEFIRKNPKYKRPSAGDIEAAFKPDPSRSFNRGFTTYFFNDRQSGIYQPDTPKSIGQELGKVVDIRKDSFRIDTPLKISNGDGLCYKTQAGVYDGLRVNKADGQWVTPLRMPKDIQRGMVMRRNLDVAFEQQIGENKTTRTIPVKIDLAMGSGSTLYVTISDDEYTTMFTKTIVTDRAQNPIVSEQNIVRQFSKLGQTPYRAEEVNVSPEVAELFFPASELNLIRREAIENHTACRIAYNRPEQYEWKHTSHAYPVKTLGRSGNITNSQAKAFYERHGCRMEEWGYERQSDYRGNVVMTTRHCLLHSLGMCLKEHPERRKMMPLTLSGEHGRYEVTTNCALCEMIIKKK